MDLRKKIYIHPFHIKELDLHPEKAEIVYDEDDDGNEIERSIPYRPDQISLDLLVSYCEKNNIPRSEYRNIKIQINYYNRSSDTYLGFYQEKPKTHKEIDEELLKEESKKLLAKIEKDKRKIERGQKKLEKQKVIESLSEEQKRALNI